MSSFLFWLWIPVKSKDMEDHDIVWLWLPANHDFPSFKCYNEIFYLRFFSYKIIENIHSNKCIVLNKVYQLLNLLKGLNYRIHPHSKSNHFQNINFFKVRTALNFPLFNFKITNKIRIWRKLRENLSFVYFEKFILQI